MPAFVGVRSAYSAYDQRTLCMDTVIIRRLYALRYSVVDHVINLGSRSIVLPKLS